MKVIYLGAGTFWLTEAIYKCVRGVTEVLPGYMGGEVANPTSEVVASGTTGHVEVVKILYDHTVMPTEELLRIFYTIHDPGTSQHPGHGIGSQYRSVIFYTDESEGEAADPKNGADIGVIPRFVEHIQSKLPEGISDSTLVMSATAFYPAEEYHYDYFSRYPEAAYSMEIIAPKLESLKQKFPNHFC